MWRLLAVGLILSTLCGCASQISAVFSKPVWEDNVEDVLSTVSLSADRRTVVVVTHGSNKGKFCAEPPPDSATSLATALDARVKGPKADFAASVSDNVTTTVTVIAARTANLDAFRTGMYALCQMSLNTGLSAIEIATRFDNLIEMYKYVAVHGPSEAAQVQPQPVTTSDRATPKGKSPEPEKKSNEPNKPGEPKPAGGR